MICCESAPNARLCVGGSSRVLRRRTARSSGGFHVLLMGRVSDRAMGSVFGVFSPVTSHFYHTPSSERTRGGRCARPHLAVEGLDERIVRRLYVADIDADAIADPLVFRDIGVS